MPSCARKYQLADSLVYHVFNRSNGRVFIFNSEEDFQHLRQLLRGYNSKFNAKIYHWVIMQNHFHLLLEMEYPERLSRMMAGFARAYTHYYHGKFKTAGYLWQGRFKAQAVQKDEYMIACGRYIERNPVKAGIVKQAHEYPHSSAQFYCLGVDDGITSEDPVYIEYGRDKTEREAKYGEFLNDFDVEQKEQFDEMEKPVGCLEFLRRLVQVNGRLVSRRRGKPGNINCVTY